MLLYYFWFLLISTALAIFLLSVSEYVLGIFYSQIFNCHQFSYAELSMSSYFHLSNIESSTFFGKCSSSIRRDETQQRPSALSELHLTYLNPFSFYLYSNLSNIVFYIVHHKISISDANNQSLFLFLKSYTSTPYITLYINAFYILFYSLLYWYFFSR